MKYRWLTALIGASVLCCGFWFYLEFRTLPLLKTLFGVENGFVPTGWLESVLWSSLPSFFYTLGLGLVCSCVTRIPNRVGAIVVSVIGLGVGIELLESVFSIGTFDPMDIVFLIAGGLAAFSVLQMLHPRFEVMTTSRQRRLFGPVFVTVMLASTATSSKDHNPGWKQRYVLESPIYMSLEELRSGVAVEEPQAVGQIREITTIGSWLLLLDHNVGVHVTDWRDPNSPSKVSTIKIPGASHMVVQGNKLWVDSYVDLVVFDLTKITQPEHWSQLEVQKRFEGLFEWNPYHFTPARRIQFRAEDLDTGKGVIIGSELFQDPGTTEETAQSPSGIDPNNPRYSRNNLFVANDERVLVVENKKLVDIDSILNETLTEKDFGLEIHKVFLKDGKVILVGNSQFVTYGIADQNLASFEYPDFLAQGYGLSLVDSSLVVGSGRSIALLDLNSGDVTGARRNFFVDNVVAAQPVGANIVACASHELVWTDRATFFIDPAISGEGPLPKIFQSRPHFQCSDIMVVGANVMIAETQGLVREFSLTNEGIEEVLTFQF